MHWKEQFDDQAVTMTTQMGTNKFIPVEKAKRFTKEIIEEVIDEIPVPTKEADMSLLYLGNDELKQQLKERWL